MSHFKRTATAIVAAVTLLGSVVVLGHEMTVMGSVAAIEPARIQVKVTDQKKTESSTWYPIDAKTKITRGQTVVTLAQAKITVNERVVLIVDHESDTEMRTLEIRLQETKAK